MIGVAGTGAPAGRIAAALADRGADVLTGEPGEIADADVESTIAAGEGTMIALARVGFEGPVLPVDAGPGFDSTPAGEVPDALDRLLAGAYDTADHPVLAVSVGDDALGRALLDVMLVTGTPGGISEYAVAAADRLDRFRADGVVVATPAGSRGYARAVGGPVVHGATDVLAVVPVAAFRTRRTTWVVDPPVSLSVERDEAAVSLLLDDTEHPDIDRDRTVVVRVAGHLPVVVPDA